MCFVLTAISKIIYPFWANVSAMWGPLKWAVLRVRHCGGPNVLLLSSMDLELSTGTSRRTDAAEGPAHQRHQRGPVVRATKNQRKLLLLGYAEDKIPTKARLDALSEQTGL